MSSATPKPYTKGLRQLMADKSHVLSKAQALSDMGMSETAEPLWASAAEYEERIGALLDSLGHELEAAVHRISAASCYEKLGDPSRAANLYRAALAGPITDATRRDVQRMLADCLSQVARTPSSSARLHGARDIATPAS